MPEAMTRAQAAADAVEDPASKGVVCSQLVWAPGPHPLQSSGPYWAEADPDVTPILSDCDIEGIRNVFGWFYNNEPPHPSPVAEVIC